MSACTIAPLLSHHWPQVREIYAAGMATGLASFRGELPSWEEWDASHTPQARLVALLENDVIGWAALSPAYDRGFYWGVVEDSIYLAPGHSGQGVGKQLLQALIPASEAAGFWCLEARVIAENAASLALHKTCGFRDVGTRERFGRMASTGQWHDVVFLEYRSKVTGLE